MTSRRQLFRFFWRYTAPWRLQQAHLAVVSLGLAFVALAFPFILKYAVNEVTNGTLGRHLQPLLFMTATVILSEAGLTWLQGCLAAKVSVSLLNRVRTDLHHRMLQMPWSYWTKGRNGLVANLILSDSMTVQVLAVQIVQTGVNNLFSLVMSLSALISLSWPLCIVVVLVMPLFWWQTNHYGRVLKQLSTQRTSKADDISSHLLETLSKLKVLKVNVAEAWRENGFAAVLRPWSATVSDGILKETLLDVTGSGLVSVVLMASLVLGALSVDSGNLTLGALVAFLTLVQRVFAPMKALSQWAVRLQASTVSLERIMNFMQLPLEPAAGPGASEKAVDKLAVCLAGVQFRYDPDRSVLEDVSFTVTPGSCVALVGPSGSGKSTLAELLVGLYPVSGGRLTVFGVDVERIPPSELRRRVAYVPQEPVLFRGTVRDNLLLGLPACDDARLQTVARLSGLEHVIARLPNGFDTSLGAEGGGLSFGERQRLCIARALLRDPEILILDEVTAGLDTESEQIIVDRLTTLSCTRVVITHKESTARISERLLVLQKGRVNVTGTEIPELAVVSMEGGR